MSKECLVVVRAEDLPQRVVVIGCDGKPSVYQMVPTRKCKGAQLCAVRD